jgi:GMP synthase (glutamine-hydrolysing)
MNILIVERETPDLVDAGQVPVGVAYGKLLQAISPAVRIAVAEPYRNELSEQALATIDAVVFPGASVSWSADDPRAMPVRQVMERVFAAGLPCFGSCNGLQLAAVILGERVETREPEVGLARENQLTEAGKQVHG